MRTYIKVDKDLRYQMMSEFGISRNSLYENLNGLTKSQLGENIRAYALAHGGKLVCEAFVPSCETKHLGHGLIVQTFAGGISVHLDTFRNTASICMNGREIHHYSEVTMASWGNILWIAQDYAEGKPEN